MTKINSEEIKHLNAKEDALDELVNNFSYESEKPKNILLGVLLLLGAAFLIFTCYFSETIFWVGVTHNVLVGLLVLFLLLFFGVTYNDLQDAKDKVNRAFDLHRIMDKILNIQNNQIRELKSTTYELSDGIQIQATHAAQELEQLSNEIEKLRTAFEMHILNGGSGIEIPIEFPEKFQSAHDTSQAAHNQEEDLTLEFDEEVEPK